MKRISILAAAIAVTCIVGCRHDDAVVTPGAGPTQQIGVTTTTGADLPQPATSPATAAPPATSSLEGAGGGMAPGMPASFPRGSALAAERGATRAAATSGTPATALESTVVPAAVVDRTPADPAASEPLVVPGLESTTQYGYQGPTGGPMRPGAAANPDTTSGAR